MKVRYTYIAFVSLFLLSALPSAVLADTFYYRVKDAGNSYTFSLDRKGLSPFQIIAAPSLTTVTMHLGGGQFITMEGALTEMELLKFATFDANNECVKVVCDFNNDGECDAVSAANCPSDGPVVTPKPCEGKGIDSCVVGPAVSQPFDW